MQKNKRTNCRKILAGFRLAFGIHNGRPLSAVPASYLTWAVRNPGKVPAADRWAIAEYLKAAGNSRHGRRTRKRQHRARGQRRKFEHQRNWKPGPIMGCEP